MNREVYESTIRMFGYRGYSVQKAFNFEEFNLTINDQSFLLDDDNDINNQLQNALCLYNEYTNTICYIEFGVNDQSSDFTTRFLNYKLFIEPFYNFCGVFITEDKLTQNNKFVENQRSLDIQHFLYNEILVEPYLHTYCPIM